MKGAELVSSERTVEGREAKIDGPAWPSDPSQFAQQLRRNLDMFDQTGRQDNVKPIGWERDVPAVSSYESVQPCPRLNEGVKRKRSRAVPAESLPKTAQTASYVKDQAPINGYLSGFQISRHQVPLKILKPKIVIRRYKARFGEPGEADGIRKVQWFTSTVLWGPKNRPDGFDDTASVGDGCPVAEREGQRSIRNPLGIGEVIGL